MTVNYHTQQFQLAQAVPGNGLNSDLVSFDSSASVGCPVSHSVSGSYIGIIVVCSALAVILMAILFLWFYKWRRARNDVVMVTGLKKSVRELTERMLIVEDFVKSQPHEVEGRPVAEHIVEGIEMEGHGVEPPERHESFGSSEMAADTGHLESIIRNLAGRVERVEDITRPQPIMRPGTNPFRNGMVPRERHGSNVSSEPPDRSPLQSITETQLGRRNTANT
jgi:hypothetical protein